MYVIKRDGSEVVFDIDRIINAITKANNVVKTSDNKLSENDINLIAYKVKSKIAEYNRAFSVEEIQDIVEEFLVSSGKYFVAREYITYRYKKNLERSGNDLESSILSIINLKNELAIQENANKNPIINSTQRDYIAGEISKELCKKYIYPKHIIEAHEKGLIHNHDMDYKAQKMNNCGLVALDDMLQNGTVISGTMIEKPHSFSTACNIATQCIAQIASSQYGGQSINLAHLVPFVDVSRLYITKEVEEEFDGIPVSAEYKQKVINKRLRKEINKGIQILQYQIITLMTTNGQAPFITLFMYFGDLHTEQEKEDMAMLVEEVLNQRLTGVKNEKGQYITTAFPKLIYVLDEDNVNEDYKYYYLTELAAECTAKRLVPDYVSEKIMKQLKVDTNGDGQVFAPMGCRSCLSPYLDEDGKPRYWSRFNQGVCTINLPDVALSSGGDYDKFWKIFDERLELCYEALYITHKNLLGTPSDVAPILWQYGAYARLKKGEPIDKLLFGGYSTISLGYAGLYECVKYMTGKSHTDEEAKPFAISVMKHMNDKCDEWYAKTNVKFSIYGTPIESTTYKFAKCLQNRFGIIKDVTDHNYITNSYHVNVREKIDAFSKLKFESEFQALSSGGAISYVEVPNMQNNIPAVLSVMKFIYNNIMYAELNTKSDYCQVCGYEGEIEMITDEHNKLIWECPNCKNRDKNKMNVARRTCGYIGLNDFNQGRMAEIGDRELHL